MLPQPQAHLITGSFFRTQTEVHPCLVMSDSSVTLWIVDPQALLSMGFSRQEHWSGLPCPPPGGLPNPGIKPRSPTGFFTLQATREESVSQFSHSVRLFATPWTAACQDSPSITNSQSLLKLMSIESVVPSNHLILCHFLLLLPSIFPSIRVFSNESVLHIRCPKSWSFSFSISPFRTDFL